MTTETTTYTIVREDFDTGRVQSSSYKNGMDALDDIDRLRRWAPETTKFTLLDPTGAPTEMVPV